MSMSQDDILECLLVLNETVEELNSIEEDVEQVWENLERIADDVAEKSSMIDGIIYELKSLLDEDHRKAYEREATDGRVTLVKHIEE
jgi:ABC-type transporter Mla subunit MlaD